jgi:hypothetical protein
MADNHTKNTHILECRATWEFLPSWSSERCLRIGRRSGILTAIFPGANTLLALMIAFTKMTFVMLYLHARSLEHDG